MSATTEFPDGGARSRLTYAVPWEERRVVVSALLGQPMPPDPLTGQVFDRMVCYEVTTRARGDLAEITATYAECRR